MINQPEEWIKLLLAMSLALGVWVALTLLVNRTGNQLANRLLTALVVLMLLPPVNVYAQMAFGTIDWCWTLTTNLTWLYGPLLLGFVQAIRAKPLTRFWPWHLLPFAFTLVWRFAGAPVSAPLIAGALITHLLIYLGLSVALTLRYREAMTARIKGHKTEYFYWLLYVVAGVATLMLIDVLLIVRFVWFEPMAVWPWRFLVMCTSLYLHGLAFVCIYRPKLMLNETQEVIRQVVTQLAPPREPALAESTAAELKQILNELMQRERAFLDNDLSLTGLAQRLGVSSHQLSSLLNDYLQQSFYDYINRFRLDEAEHLLRSRPQMPIVELAYEAGFNNKNSFYRLFKQRTGMTPSQYRKLPVEQKASA